MKDVKDVICLSFNPKYMSCEKVDRNLFRFILRNKNEDMPIQVDLLMNKNDIKKLRSKLE